MEKYLEYTVKEAQELLAIDSPTGYTENAENYVIKVLEEMGYSPKKLVKGGVIVCLGGNNEKDAVLLASHIDTLGGMVAEVKSDGRLRLSPLGGMNANNAEGENCRVVTKFSGSYEGTFQLINASIHVNSEYNETSRNYEKTEVVLDEKVKNKEEVKALGINTGDIVCFEPRTRVTEKGFIKSRFLDDKLSAAILLGYAKYVSEEKVTLPQKVYLMFTVYEEVGHGATAAIPEDVKEIISVDMGCVGNGLECTEHQVSICSKDSMGPYNYEVVKGLIAAAQKNNIDYAVDIYPRYGSDVEGTIKAGYDIRHGLIGPGVYASHGYERSHKEGVLNTLKLIKEYLA